MSAGGKLLKLPRAEPSDAVVRMCERLLSLAQSGDLRALAVGGSLVGGESLNAVAFSEGCDLGHCLIGLERAKKMVLEEDGS